MSSEVFWRDLKYIQRDVENKQKFSDNWDLIFKKNKEQTDADNQDNHARTQQEDGL